MNVNVKHNDASVNMNFSQNSICWNSVCRNTVCLPHHKTWLCKHLIIQDNARVGDAYMNQVQSFAAYIPYMTCPGNHEAN